MVSYRRRRDLMLKKHSHLSLHKSLCEVVYRNHLVVACPRGRPCEVPKHKLICFILQSKMYGDGYEEMELDSEIFLGRHYDHSSFGYHFSKLPDKIIQQITNYYERLIMRFLDQEIILHIFDSTALSTSVREERTRQGLRKKEKLTQKYHTLLGYDPPNQIVVVEADLATDNHTSDSQGALLMLPENKKGYSLGDGAYETYDLTQATEEKGLVPVYKATKKAIAKKLSAKSRRRKVWDGNPKRLYKEIRGVGEVLYGAATRAGLIHTQSRREDNRQKDALVIGLRQNFLTYLRLEALRGIFRKTRTRGVVANV